MWIYEKFCVNYNQPIFLLLHRNLLSSTFFFGGEWQSTHNPFHLCASFLFIHCIHSPNSLLFTTCGMMRTSDSNKVVKLYEMLKQTNFDTIILLYNCILSTLNHHRSLSVITVQKENKRRKFLLCAAMNVKDGMKFIQICYNDAVSGCE